MAGLNVFDCFCGLGGFSLGAELAGHTVAGGVDANPDAVDTFRGAFPNSQALHHNLLTESADSILRQAKIVRGDIDVLLGGPPCQPYSINNHQRGVHDARCGLIESYLAFVSALRPEWLVIENVPGIASVDGGKFLVRLLRALRGRGYACRTTILNAVAFGVPQRRRRLVILASRNSNNTEAAIAELNLFATRGTKLGAAIGDLPDSPSPNAKYAKRPTNEFQRTMRTNRGTELSGHVARPLGAENLKRIKHVPQGGNWRNIPRTLLPKGMRRARLSDHTTRYGRLSPSTPAFTLLTKCDPHWGCFVHPTQDRVITVREAARIQSIPDHVDFPVTLTSSYRMIGNAVPPLLAKKILEVIASK